MNERNWRRRDLDRGKTLGVLLVVLGHLVARQDPVGAGWGSAWYESLRVALYSFHIPFLFYLSGYAAGWSGAATLSGRAYGAMIARRALRWLIPGSLFGLAVVGGKVVLCPLIPVDHPPASLGAGLGALIWQTDQSPAQSVWYLFVLFGFAVAVPAVRALTGEGIRPLLLLCLPLMALPVPPILYADRFLLYLPLYLAGILAADYDRPWCFFLDRARLPLMGVLLAALLVLVLHASNWPRVATMLGASLVALPALHAMVRCLWPPLLELFDWMGPHAFAIYLLNTIFIGLAKAMMLQFLPWQASWFPLFAPVLMASGILGPILVAKVWLRRTAVIGSQRRL
jgi:hypothetical protein